MYARHLKLYLSKPLSLFLANGFCVEMEAIVDRLLCLDLRLINIIIKYLKGIKPIDTKHKKVAFKDNKV